MHRSTLVLMANVYVIVLEITVASPWLDGMGDCLVQSH